MYLSMSVYEEKILQSRWINEVFHRLVPPKMFIDIPKGNSVLEINTVWRSQMNSTNDYSLNLNSLAKENSHTKEIQMIPTTRQEAIKQNVMWYNTGKPCSRGHYADRTVNGACKICRQQASAKQNERKRNNAMIYADNTHEYLRKHQPNRYIIKLKRVDKRHLMSLYEMVRLSLTKSGKDDACRYDKSTQI